jgi:hypothetical protein
MSRRNIRVHSVHRGGLLFHPIFDVSLFVVEARLGIEGPRLAHEPPDAGELSGASGNGSDQRDGRFCALGSKVPAWRMSPRMPANFPVPPVMGPTNVKVDLPDPSL